MLAAVTSFNNDVVRARDIRSLDAQQFQSGFFKLVDEVSSQLSHEIPWGDPNLRFTHNCSVTLAAWTSTICHAKLFDTTRTLDVQGRRVQHLGLREASAQLTKIWDEGLDIGRSLEMAAKGSVREDWIPINRVEGCKFCNLTDQQLMEELPPSALDEKPLACKRGVSRNGFCLTTLAPEQLGKGHCVVIFRKRHVEDLSDGSLTPAEQVGILTAIAQAARQIKRGLLAERVYVASLCDGEEHLHFHLIPRYSTDNTGFAFVGQRETQANLGNPIGPRDRPARAKFLEELATHLRSVQ